MCKCFFCAEQDIEENLRVAATFKLYEKVQKCARKLGDMMLLGKLSARDLVAQDAMYHLKN